MRSERKREKKPSRGGTRTGGSGKRPVTVVARNWTACFEPPQRVATLPSSFKSDSDELAAFSPGPAPGRLIGTLDFERESAWR
jgi:hypothetical protein